MEKTQIIVKYNGENSNYCEIYMKKLKKDGDTRYYLRCEECIKELGE